MKRLVLAAAAVLSLGLGVASVSAQAGDCTPTCYKHPITGQLLCATPCP
ncbi:hypothetical protein [Melittangium boletus]|uniref:Lipoprotein n=1 Tax=Melittangium boletus DSM 14713 TaxID=1294270 RepID=A0A250IRL0_9BACT|nr:hypothetical protein [Melittangium boletus]ATB33791.1 hypothetical protein MEBOL_007289 [Melittangium boletus DSM 14713]